MDRMDEDLCWSNRDGLYHADTVDTVGTATKKEILNVLKVKHEVYDKRCMRELKDALTAIVYNYIHGCNST